MKARCLAALCAAFLVAHAAPAGAGNEVILYRLPDGRLGAADDERFLPPGAMVVDRVPKSAPKPRAESPPAAVDPSQAGEGPRAVEGAPAPALSDAERREAEEAAAEAMWRSKRRQANEELSRATATYRYAEEIRRECERRERTVQVVPGYGMVEKRECSPADLEFIAQATETYEEAKRYAERGIEDECRRASCLPGWIR
jgi:hypothetical protein